LKRILQWLILAGAIGATAQNFTNAVLTPITMTGVATSPALPLSSSYATGTIQLVGSSLTTATFAIYGCNLTNCTSANYFALPMQSCGDTTGTFATTQTATANSCYRVNLAGMTSVEYVTSGTFTATSITLTLTGSPNAQIGRSSSGATTLNPLTFATSGGAAPNSTFNGSAPVTVSPGTIGLQGCLTTSSTLINVACLGILPSASASANTAAIQSALSTYNGRTLYFPCGVYNTNSPITLPSYTHILGDTFGTYGSCVTAFYNNATDLFRDDTVGNSGTQFSLIENVLMHTGSSGGHLIAATQGGFNQNRWLNDGWRVDNTTSSAISVTGAEGFIQNTIEGFDAWAIASNTAPVFNITGTSANSYNDNTIEDGRITVNGGNAGTYGIVIANDASTYSTGNLIRNVVLELFPAGGIELAGLYQTEIDNVSFADIGSGSGTANSIVLTTAGGSQPDIGVTIKNSTVNMGNGTSVYDLVTNTAQDVNVENSVIGSINGNAVVVGNPPSTSVAGSHIIQINSTGSGVASAVPTQTAGTGGTSIASQAYADASSAAVTAAIQTSSPYFYTAYGGLGTWQNVFPYSETIATGWNIGGAATVTNNSATAPDSSSTAAQIVTGASGNVGVFATKNTGSTLTGNWTCSFWASASAPGNAIFEMQTDTQDVTYTKTIALTTTLTRYFITGSMTGTSRPVFQCGLQNTGTNDSLTIYLWGMQGEQGSAVTQYSRTTGNPTSLTSHTYGLRNPYHYIDSLNETVGQAIASATTIAVLNPITHITGTTTISTITIPPTCTTGYGCVVTLIPDGIFLTTTGGNIAIASTAVVSKALIMTYDPGTSKWYPSY
jgi:hypothetical protein